MSRARTTYQPEMLRLALEAGRALDKAVAHLLSAQVLHARGAECDAREHLDLDSRLDVP